MGLFLWRLRLSRLFATMMRRWDVKTITCKASSSSSVFVQVCKTRHPLFDSLKVICRKREKKTDSNFADAVFTLDACNVFIFFLSFLARLLLEIFYAHTFSRMDPLRRSQFRRRLCVEKDITWQRHHGGRDNSKKLSVCGANICFHKLFPYLRFH